MRSDGTVEVNHSGAEMGQGIDTRMAQESSRYTLIHLLGRNSIFGRVAAVALGVKVDVSLLCFCYG